MEDGHVDRQGGAQRCMARGGVKADLVGIESWHEQNRDIHPAGKPCRDIGMERHFGGYGINIFADRVDVIEHQGDASGPGLGQTVRLFTQMGEVLLIILRRVIKTRGDAGDDPDLPVLRMAAECRKLLQPVIRLGRPPVDPVKQVFLRRVQMAVMPRLASLSMIRRRSCQSGRRP